MGKIGVHMGLGVDEVIVLTLFLHMENDTIAFTQINQIYVYIIQILIVQRPINLFKSKSTMASRKIL